MLKMNMMLSGRFSKVLPFRRKGGGVNPPSKNAHNLPFGPWCPGFVCHCWFFVPRSHYSGTTWNRRLSQDLHQACPLNPPANLLARDSNLKHQTTASIDLLEGALTSGSTSLPSGVSVCCKFTKSSMGIKRGKDRQGGRDEIRQHKMIWYSISLHASLKENISTQMPFQMTDYVFKHLSVFNIIQNQNLFPKNVWAESGEILEHSSEMSQSMSTWQLEQKMYLFKPIILLWKKQSKTTTPHTQTYTHLFFLPKVFIPCKFLQRKHFRFCYLRWEVPPQGLDMIQDKKAVFNIAQILKLCYQTHTFVFESTNNLVSFICRLRHTGSSHMAMMTPLEWLCPLQYQRSPWLWRHFKACWINIPEGLVGWWRPSEKVFEVGINMASLESKTGYHSHYDVGTRGLHHETSESKIHTTFFSFC